MNQMAFDLRVDPHCRIGRIRFKRHRGREARKDKASIRAALKATTDALRASIPIRPEEGEGLSLDLTEMRTRRAL